MFSIKLFQVIVAIVRLPHLSGAIVRAKQNIYLELCCS